jgi:hypothetical protein
MAASRDDVGCDDGQPSVTWSSTEGMTYHIQVTGFNPSVLGTYTLQVTGVGSGQTLVELESPGKKQSNRLWLLNMLTSDHSWLVLTDCIAESFTTVTGDTTGAPAPTTNPENCVDEYRGNKFCTNGCPSVWHRVMGTGGIMSASTCSAPPGSQLFDIKLFLYEGRCANMTCLSANDDGCLPGASLSWESTLGAVYHIQVTGRASDKVGPFLLRVDGTEAVVQSQGTYSSMFLNLACSVSRRAFQCSHPNHFHSSLFRPASSPDPTHFATNEAAV